MAKRFEKAIYYTEKYKKRFASLQILWKYRYKNCE